MTATAQALDSGVNPEITATEQGAGSYALAFGIPAGPTGPTGPGPTLTTTTTTLDPGQQASVNVSDQGEGSYELQFSIPQGPTGPANGLNAYGGLYTLTQQTLTSLQTGTEQTINLANPMTSSNVTVTGGDNAIEITTEGNYEVSYSVVVNITEGGEVTVSVQNGQEGLAGTSQTVTTVANNDFTVSNSVITLLNVGDSLSLAITGDNKNGSIEQAELIVKKLN